jgi:glycosyltransferase involved in cell wall biosynthesis
MANTWVVIAAYNEAAVVGALVADVRQRFPNSVVVDDGSADETAAEARAAGATVVRHPINLGQGAALETGIRYALAQGAEAIATFDADGQHRVSDLEAMVERLFDGSWDVVLGSRFLGTSDSVPRGRRILLRAARLFTVAVSGVRLTDAHNGLRVLSADAARRIRIRQNRMAHASEIVHKLRALNLRYTEHAVTIDYTEHSRAKGQRWWGSINIVGDLLSELVRS